MIAHMFFYHCNNRSVFVNILTICSNTSKNHIYYALYHRELNIYHREHNIHIAKSAI